MKYVGTRLFGHLDRLLATGCWSDLVLSFEHWFNIKSRLGIVGFIAGFDSQDGSYQGLG